MTMSIPILRMIREFIKIPPYLVEWYRYYRNCVPLVGHKRFRTVKGDSDFIRIPANGDRRNDRIGRGRDRDHFVFQEVGCECEAAVWSHFRSKNTRISCVDPSDRREAQ